MSKKKKKVYILHATYKNNDPEIIGAFDSMQAMMRGFAEHIAAQAQEEADWKSISPGELVRAVAKELADLIPAFFDEDYPRDEEGYIRYGRTTYGYSILTLEGVEEEDDKEEEQCTL